MDCTLELVSEVNNGGAAFLASGHLDLAFKSFRNALELILVAMEGQQAPPSTVLTAMTTSIKASSALAQNKVVSISSPSIHNPPPSVNVATPAVHPDSPHPPSTKPPYEHPHFVFCQAMVFNPSVSLSAQKWDHLLPICLAMIQFNLALTYQMKSKDSPAGESALARALYWYDMCLAQVQQTLPTTMPLHLKVVIAAMNNMAIVNYDLCHYTKVRQIYQSVSEMMSAYSISSDNPYNFQDEDLQGLLLNIIFLHSDPIAPAA